MDYPKVATIVLNWNGLSDTIECVDSVLGATYPHNEIYIVDNASTDGSVKRFKERYQNVVIIENHGNYGYAEGNNIGIRKALQNGAEYVLILNNDTLVHPAFLDELIKAAASDERIGVLGPKMYYAEPANLIYYAGSTLNPYTSQPRHRGQKEIDTGKYDAAGETSFVAGACMLVKKQVLQKIGLLPTDYFLLWEDIDFSVNASRNGFKVVYVPASVIWHKASVSISRLNVRRIYYSSRNRIIFVKKYFSRLQQASSLVHYLAFNGPVSLAYLILLHKNLGFISHYVQGVRDGLRFRNPACPAPLQL